jgi:hypothetical protein
MNKDQAKNHRHSTLERIMNNNEPKNEMLGKDNLNILPISVSVPMLFAYLFVVIIGGFRASKRYR